MASGWSSERDLFLSLDRTGGLRDSIERSLRAAIREGRLALGVVLPSSRSLARDLGVARGTVSAAYAQLAVEGYLDLRQGAAPRVRWASRRPTPPAPLPPSQSRHQWDLRPGRPDASSFPRHAWARAQRHVLDRVPDEVFGYGDPCGHPQLCRELADYLGRARGVDTSPERLLICNGFTQALTLICLTLQKQGATTLAIEDPSAPRYRRLAERAGLTVVPVPCDREGIRTDDLACSGAQAVLVTPAHQYPLGVAMSAARRTALVDWAGRRDALIVEDDYDGEFRYDRQPVGALQQLDPEHVVYAGTASKTLAPGLRWPASPPGCTPWPTYQKTDPPNASSAPAPPGSLSPSTLCPATGTTQRSPNSSPNPRPSSSATAHPPGTLTILPSLRSPDCWPAQAMRGRAGYGAAGAPNRC